MTSIYLQGIDPDEIIQTVHARRPPMIPASVGLALPTAPLDGSIGSSPDRACAQGCEQFRDVAVGMPSAHLFENPVHDLVDFVGRRGADRFEQLLDDVVAPPALVH